MFFVFIFADLCHAAQLDKFDKPRGRQRLLQFLAQDRAVIMVQKDNFTADVVFPLTVNNSDKYFRLKNYFLSFYSIPFKFLLISCSVFFIVLLISLVSWVFFPASPSKIASSTVLSLIGKMKKKKKRTLKNFILIIQFLLICGFVIFLTYTTTNTIGLQSLFPDYYNYTNNLSLEIDEMIVGMIFGVVDITYGVNDLESWFEPFDGFFTNANRTIDKIWYNKSGSIFTNIKDLLKDFERQSEKLDKLVAMKDLQSTYTQYLDPVLPPNFKCTGECFSKLKNYNRHDIKSEQIDKIQHCKGRNGVEYQNCLDIFENSAYRFLSYFYEPYNLQESLLAEFDDWKDIYLPRMDSFLEFYLYPFADHIHSKLPEFLNAEFGHMYKGYVKGIYVCDAICGVSVVMMVIWLFYRQSIISIFSAVNALSIVVLAFFVGSFLSYSTFLEFTMSNFDKLFVGIDQNKQHASEAEAIFLRLFECKTNYFGTSMKFWNITSGHEFIINDLLMKLTSDVIPKMAEQVAYITYPLTYFAVLDPETSSTLYPYYQISDHAFQRLTSSSISSDPSFQIFNDLYDTPLDRIELNIVDLHLENNETFRRAYESLFSIDKPCTGYSLPDINECAKNITDENYLFLKSHPLTEGLTHLSAIRSTLKEFSKYGEIYEVEKDLIDTLTRIVKFNLYQVSNYIASVYVDLSKIIASYQEMIYSEDYLYGFFQSSQTVVNGSCLKINGKYNEFRKLLLSTIPTKAYTLCISLLIVVAIPVLISLLGVLHKLVHLPDDLKLKKRREKKKIKKMNKKMSLNESTTQKTTGSDSHQESSIGSNHDMNDSSEIERNRKKKKQKKNNVQEDDTSDEETFGQNESLAFAARYASHVQQMQQMQQQQMQGECYDLTKLTPPTPENYSIFSYDIVNNANVNYLNSEKENGSENNTSGNQMRSEVNTDTFGVSTDAAGTGMDGSGQSFNFAGYAEDPMPLRPPRLRHFDQRDEDSYSYDSDNNDIIVGSGKKV